MESSQLIDLLLTYKYLILFPLAFLEGPVVSLVVGFLIYSGHMLFLPSFVIIIFGDLLPDNMFYFLGKNGGKKEFTQRILNKTPFVITHFAVLKKLWTDHGFKTMFLSKFSRGISAVLMITAGLAEMPFRKFFFDSTFVTIVKYFAMILIGYFVGQSYSLSSSYRYVEVIGVAISVLTIVIFSMLSNYARKKMMD